MRILLLLPLLPLPALAQVTTNDSALQALTPAAPLQAAPPSHKAAPALHSRRTVRRGGPPSRDVKSEPLPAVPAAPPANPVLMPPPPVLPAHPPALPPAIKPNPQAPTRAMPLKDGTRLVFGAGNAELNQGSLDALEAVAAAAKADPQMEINITAWAPGVPEDPSTPHRLSLDRALAGRAVFIHAGIASERIHAIAKGFNDIAGGPPDRMDVVAVHPASTPAGTPAPPGPK